MSLHKTATVMLAIGSAIAGVVAALGAIKPVYGMIGAVVGPFLMMFSKSILDSEKGTPDE